MLVINKPAESKPVKAVKKKPTETQKHICVWIDEKGMFHFVPTEPGLDNLILKFNKNGELTAAKVI